jgi:muconolactone D-isomerase
VEFLVSMEVEPSVGLARAELLALVPAEREAGRRLVEDGTLSRAWRLPGRWATLLLMSVEDTDHLHDALSTLPLLAHARVTVTALAQHPLERAVPVDTRTETESDV